MANEESAISFYERVLKKYKSVKDYSYLTIDKPLI